MTTADFERSPRFRTPAFRYIRQADRLPSTEEARAAGMAARVLVKLFNPTGAGTWFITGYDPETRIATGAADLGYGAEVGDFYMPELVDLRLRFGLAIERDLWWTPVGLAEAIR